METKSNYFDHNNALIINKELYDFYYMIKGANLTAPKEWHNEQVWDEVRNPIVESLDNFREYFDKETRIAVIKRLIVVVLMRETLGFYGLSIADQETSVHDQMVHFKSEKIIPRWECKAVAEHDFITKILSNEFVMQQITLLMQYEVWNYEEATKLLPH